MDVKRILAVTLLATATLLAWLSSWLYFSEQEPDESPYWWRGLGASGRVVRIVPGLLTIGTDEGTLDFVLDRQTRVLLLGEVSLVTGTPVQIKYRDSGDRRVARAVRVLRSYTDGAPLSPVGVPPP